MAEYQQGNGAPQQGGEFFDYTAQAPAEQNPAQAPQQGQQQQQQDPSRFSQFMNTFREQLSAIQPGQKAGEQGQQQQQQGSGVPPPPAQSPPAGPGERGGETRSSLSAIQEILQNTSAEAPSQSPTNATPPNAQAQPHYVPNGHSAPPQH